MAEFDAETFSEQTVLIGLLTREQVRLAMNEAEDGTLDALTRTLVRKGFLTGWQVDKLKKGEVSGFFFGGNKVLFHIAEGTFARVYRGVKVPGGQSVAVKVLRNRFVSDASAVARFNQEAEAGMKLIHPNIVRTFDYGQQDNRHYMIMEFVEGSNLRDFLKTRVRLTAGEALPLMLGLAHGLKYSLDQGVTHRDIKGTNVLVASNGTAKLVDFGLATIEGDEKRMAIAHGQRTVDYSALERTCGSPKGDPRSDIYFLGCVFYQMLTGTLPMPEAESKDPLAKMLKRSFGAIKPLSELRNAPPPEITRIIEKMMQMDLKKRYQSMDEVVADLEAYHREVQSALSKPAPKPKPNVAAVSTTPASPPSIASRASEPPLAPSAGSSRNDGSPPDKDEFDEGEFEIAAAVETPGIRVLCVESQEPIRDAFRRTLAKMGYRVWLVSSAELAAERYKEEPPDVVVFDADGLGPQSLESFAAMHEKAHADGHELSALVLLGPRQGGLAHKLPDDDRLIVMTKPIKMKDVQDALETLAPID